LPVERGTMSMETFIRIIDQLSPYVRYMSLYYLGEPLFCKHLPEMISYARRHKIRIFLSSNLNILDEKMAEDLTESKLDYLIVSLDGTSQESYEKYRVGGDFNKVINNIRLIIDKKIQKNTPYPRIVIQPVVFKHNEREIPKLSALADSLGVKMFIRQGLLGGEGQSPPVTKDLALARKWLSQDRRYHKDFDYLSDKPYLKNEPCIYLWNAVAINWDGTVFPCCWLYENKYSVGNIMEQDFETIWNNELYVSSRSLFARRKSKFLKSTENLPQTICYQCKIFRHNLNDE
jgi:radical SAM protein with 4Fe4S-binding SPASM domain